MDIVGKKWYFFTLSILITLAGLIALAVNGLVMDIEFKGGNIIQVDIGKQFDNNEVARIVETASGVKQPPIIQKTGAKQDKVSISTTSITDVQRNNIVNALKQRYGFTSQPTFKTVQPTFGVELQRRAILATIVSSLGILVYVAFRFRTMSGFSAGTTAVVSLVHDAFIMLSVYSIFRVPLNSAFVAAVLTILGYSINDTIIVYDRIRENQLLLKKMPVAELVNKSIMQTMKRSVYTVVTVLICIASLFIYGSIYNQQTIKDFTFPLLIGVTSGCYSSIFIASPLWVMWQESNSKKTVKKA